MMKNIIFGLLFLPTLTLAQEHVIVEKPVVCDKIETILHSITNEFSEKSIWLGVSGDSNYSLFVNKNGAWTIIQFTDRIACIIGTGEISKQIFDFNS
jgi:hypothetical protein